MFLLLMSLSFVFGVFSSPKVEAACSWTKYAYVNSSSGTDYGTGTCWGTSSGTAYKTVQAALDARNAHYSGTEITIYFKGDTNQTANNSPSTNDVYIRPQTLGASTNALLTIKGKNNIRVESFKFNGAGGVKVTSQNDYVLIENNIFNTTSTGIEVTGSGQVNIIDNDFNSGWVYAHDNTELVALDLNDFTGAASKTADGVKWHVVASNLTGGFYFLGSDVTSTSGNVLYASNVDGANIMGNTVDGAGTTATAFYLYRVDGSYLTDNELSDVRYGIRMLGDRLNTYDYVNNNVISLADSSTVEAVGLDIQLYSSVDEVLSNVISGGDYAIKLYPAVVDLIQYNTLASSVADIYAENSMVTQILTNILTSSGTNIHFVSSSFSEIAQNAVWSTVYGMLFETGRGEISSSRQEGADGDPSGTAVVVQGDIHNNDFYKSNLALGLYNYTVDEIYSNKFREVEDGVYAYYANANSFRENELKHDGALATLDEGIYLYDTEIKNFKRNSVTDFFYGLYEAKGSNIPDGFIRNAFSKGQMGIYLDGASITASMKNNTFTSSETALYVNGDGTSGVNFVNNTLYGQSNYPINLGGTFFSSSTIVNNIFSEFNPVAPVYVADLAILSVLDSNLYGHTVGGDVLKDAVGSYSLSDAQAFGFETKGYEETVNTLVNPMASDLHLMGWSLAVNSADMAYAPTMDMDGLIRPICMSSDRGAYEVNGGGMVANADLDGDGLCGFQETAWSTSTANSDTDADTLSDYDEVYVYHTAPTVSDTDGDGYLDGEEITAGTDPLDASSHGNDSDHDGMDDAWETSYGLDPTDASDASLDLDSDGLNNLDEYTAGTDPTDVDSDDDLLEDGDEASYGADPLDADTDGDGFEDGFEVSYGSDPADASSTPSTLDTDGDGLSDLEETSYGTDPYDADTDADGLNDGDELLIYFSDPLVSDTDSDGLTDGEEVSTYGSDPTSTDSDSDGLTDNEEVAGTYGYVTDPVDSDTDGDGFTDYEEIFASSDPTDASSTPDTTDTDGDGLYDVIETAIGTDLSDTDSDNDGLSDGEEVLTYGTDPLLTDSDSDGLENADEITMYSTDPADDDSDNDGLTDGEEVLTYGTDANDRDTDGDTLVDGIEVGTYGTDPANADTDSDGLSDYQELFVDFTDPNDTDSDDDNITDGDEVSLYGTDPNSADTDTDGLSDEDELFVYGTDPSSRDTDGDSLWDADEIIAYGTSALLADTDSDGLTDYEEIMGSYGTDALNADTDSDGLSDGDEVAIYGSDPTLTDTDSDGLSDNDEVIGIYGYITDPADADTDGDTYSDNTEITLGTDPTDAADFPVITDTDGDGLLDTEETAGTYGYVTDPADVDSDDDTLSDYDEIFAYFSDPTTNDTDGDLFTDAYEVAQGTSPSDSAYSPSIPVTVVAYNSIAGYGTSGSWLGSLSLSYTSATTLNISNSSPLNILAAYPGYGVFGLSWSSSDYLGSLTVTDCGYSASSFDASAVGTCSTIPDYDVARDPESQTTHVTDVSQIDVWTTMSAYYVYSSLDWYRLQPASTSYTSYVGLRLTLVP